ncbi:MAG TPA: hypothetical protein DCS91_15100 [Microcoleaceae bacterium UBA11344]|jgi:hypothetical protein|nr:hypothetical protein [Microcoleaceae cyanobacterium UBA11344]
METHQFLSHHPLQSFIPDSSQPLILKEETQNFPFASHLKVEQIMDCQMRMFIPTQDKNGDPVDYKIYVKLFTEWITQTCGGCTHKNFLGFYENQAKTILQEEVYEIEVWMTKNKLLQLGRQIEEFICRLLQDLNQEVVLVIINNTATLLRL